METIRLSDGLTAVIDSSTEGKEKAALVVADGYLSTCSCSDFKQLREEAAKAGTLVLEMTQVPGGARHVFHTVQRNAVEAVRMLYDMEKREEKMDTRNNRNFDQRVRAEYTAQQNILKEICKEMGIVLFYPDYHAKGTDKNTVLLYSKAAAEYNLALDSIEQSMGFSIPSEKYRMHFFQFENSDVNGCFSYEFANHGAIDLRGLHVKETIQNAIEDAWKEYTGDSSLPNKYVAVVRQRATRDIQVCTSLDCDATDEDSWVDWREAEAYIGVFEGSESVAIAKAAAYAQLPSENIRLIPLVA